LDNSVTLVTSLEEGRAAYQRFVQGDGFLSFDTETTGLYVRTPHGDRARTVQFSWRPWEEAVVFEVKERYLGAITAFFGAATGVVGHNVRFDVHAMASEEVFIYKGFAPEDVHDTVWLARLHDERDNAQLKPLSDKYLGAESSAEQAALKRVMKKNGWTWATVPVKFLVEYGGLDAILTGQLFDLLYGRIGYALGAYEREQRLSAVLYAMERKGILMDIPLLTEIESEMQNRVDEDYAILQEAKPGLNPNAPLQVKAMFKERGIDLPNTKEATLKAHSGKDPLIATLLEYRKADKMLSTYIRKWYTLITPEGRMHPNFNQLGAKTGRFSSSDPNLQNVKRGPGLRDVFIAEEGSKMVVADWEQMELRLYAHFAEDENMRAAFLSGDDIYQQAADLLGVTRQVGKMIMLASIYGAGPAALKTQCINQAYQFNIPEIVPTLEGYDWIALHKRFHSLYNIKKLAQSTEYAAQRRGQLGEAYINTLGGRRQRPKRFTLPPTSSGYRHEVLIYKDLANSLVQGSASDLMKMAILDVADAGYKDMLRLTVHDEMVLEVPDDKVQEVEEAIGRLMTRNEFVPPLTVEASHAQRYGEAK